MAPMHDRLVVYTVSNFTWITLDKYELHVPCLSQKKYGNDAV